MSWKDAAMLLAALAAVYYAYLVAVLIRDWRADRRLRAFLSSGPKRRGVLGQDMTANEVRGWLTFGDFDKPHCRPECECDLCEAWRSRLGRPTRAEMRAWLTTLESKP